jgi:prepilin-type N-terminal cleavage/methylation domain-containing protein/prepilin-type processing-associated H-X9-DG protein
MKERRRLQSQSSATAGFSLIELLVVLVVMTLLLTLYWNHGPSKRDVALGACRQNLEKVYLALQIYSRENGDKYPVFTNAATSEQALGLLVPKYTSDTSVFICPAAGGEPLPTGKAFADWKISYAYYMGRHGKDTDKALMSDAQVDTTSKGAGATIFSENGRPPGNNHGKHAGNILMGDGSVASITGKEQFPVSYTPPVVLLNPKP